MFVACSTLCFARQSLEDALRSIGELRFSKFDMAIHEHGRQLKPSQVVADVSASAARLRNGFGLAPIAFSVDIDAPADERDTQFKAVCRLARIVAVPLLTVRPSPLDVPPEAEVKRLKHLSRLAEAEGLILTVSTLGDTHTGTPEGAEALCEKVPGLALTLDPSHYTVTGANFDAVMPHVRHLHLRDTGKGPEQYQVRVGQGAVEYGRILAHLGRMKYKQALSVDIRDIADGAFATGPEVRKLKYLLESLV